MLCVGLGEPSLAYMTECMNYDVAMGVYPCS